MQRQLGTAIYKQIAAPGRGNDVHAATARGTAIHNTHHP